MYYVLLCVMVAGFLVYLCHPGNFFLQRSFTLVTMDVYNSLSFEYELLNNFSRRIKSSNNQNIKNLTDSFVFKIFCLRRGIDRDSRNDVVFFLVVSALTEASMAEIKNISFEDSENESEQNIFMRSMHPDDKEQCRRKIQKVHQMFKEQRDDFLEMFGIQEDDEIFCSGDDEGLVILADISIACIRKLPMGGSSGNMKESEEKSFSSDEVTV